MPTPTLELLDRALDQTGTLIDHVQPSQAELPTPCSEWHVRALVNHIVYDLRTFATLLTGGERGSPDVDLLGNDWPSAYRAAADNLMETWRKRGTEGTLKTRVGEFPAAWGIGQHMGDIAVHGWDLARAIGQPSEGDTEVGEVSLEWARENLKPQFRGQAFGSEVAVSESAPLYDRLAAYFGRDPGR